MGKDVISNKVSFLNRLTLYHNIVYLLHIFVVAPLLFIVAYKGLEKQNVSYPTNMKTIKKIDAYEGLLILQGSLAIMVASYHGYKLYKSLFTV